MKTEGVLRAILLSLYISKRLFKPRSLYLSSVSEITVSVCLSISMCIIFFLLRDRDSDQFFYISNEDRDRSL